MYFKDHEMDDLKISQNDKIVSILMVSHLMLSLCLKKFRSKTNAFGHLLLYVLNFLLQSIELT